MRGVPLSPGIVWGRAVLFETQEESLFRVTLDADKVGAEVERFRAARAATMDQIRAIRDSKARELGDEFAAIFDAHLLMAEDVTLSQRTEEMIVRERMNAEWAVKAVVDQFLAVLAGQDNQLIQERAADLEDVARRIQKNLAGSATSGVLQLGDDVVIIAPGLSPSDAVLLDKSHVRAFATDRGGATSHTAIIARSLEIPAVVGLRHITRRVKSGDLVLVDGLSGEVILRPTAEVIDAYRRKRDVWLKEEEKAVHRAAEVALTADGVRVAVRANVDLPSEVQQARRLGAEGIGLYRSEFLFLQHGASLPTEEHHFRAYDDMARSVYPQKVTIRTLDLGGEKYFHDVLERGESNPVLGMRAIRFCLKRPDLFLDQIRGILRASHRGNVEMMFPLISSVDELRRARALVEGAKNDLRKRKIPFDGNIPVGIMVEVPSAALVADLLAKECDFFAVGTNDLIQYVLAIDRNNDSVSHLYEPLHPAVLRLIGRVARAGQAAGIRVSVCGEMAAVPRFAQVLVGLGVRELSMTPTSIPQVKDALRRIDAGDMADHALRWMDLPRARDVESALTRFLQKPVAGRKKAVRA